MSYFCNTHSKPIQPQTEGGDCALTVKAAPSGDVAGVVMGEGGAGRRDTGGHYGVREGDGGLQLDQGNVITAEETHTHIHTHKLRVIID